MIDRGIDLYPAQEEAILEILDDRHVLLNTPTGSGKSLVAVAMHFRSLCCGRRSFYTSPIKALVSEKFFDLCRTFGAENVGMLTGDASINPRAPIICCTAEVLANMALRSGLAAGIDAVIMDEFHYYSDRDRGRAWQVPLLCLPRTIFMLMSATLGDTTDIERRLHDLSGRSVSVVRSTERPVPLDFSYVESPLHETIQQLLDGGRAPIYVVNFTQREATELAQSLTSINVHDRDTKLALKDEIGHFRFDSPFGRKIGRYVHHGIGLHHAGLLPKYRLLVERLAQKGFLRVISGTDTLGVGVNVPIRTVLFTRLCKFDGQKVGILSVRDFRQIAGRAGRKGFDDRGWVVCQAPEHVIENRKMEARVAAGKMPKKKFVRAQPPKRGFVPWNEETFDQLRRGTPEHLQSRFEVDHGMIMNLLQRPDDDGLPGGYRGLVTLIARSHDPPEEHPAHRRRARTLFQALRRAGIVDTRRNDNGPGSHVVVNEVLQENFSLDQALGLFLVHAIEVLEARGLPPEQYALTALSLVESIQEHPHALLRRQVDRRKTEALAAMKAEGMDYEDRIAELQEITWDKPDAEFIYDIFNRWAERHPWLDEENIRPKSIARDLVERWMSFGEYVNEYGLEAMEGTLLRYLSSVYRTLVRTLPPAWLNDPLMDIVGYFDALLRRVDSSLLQEWEQLMAPTDDDDEPAAPVERDLRRDPRALFSRVRGELHLLVRALSLQDWDEATLLVRQAADDPWPPERFASSLEPFFEEYGHMVFDSRARLAELTRFETLGNSRWSVRQTLLDPQDDRMWFIDAEIELEAGGDPDDPLIRVLDIRD